MSLIVHVTTFAGDFLGGRYSSIKNKPPPLPCPYVRKMLLLFSDGGVILKLIWKFLPLE